MRSEIFLIQMGHIGRRLTEQAINHNYSDGAILSPSDYNLDKNKDLSNIIHQQDGIVLFDNHWYLPRSSRPKLLEYDYFERYGGDDYNTSDMDSEVERKKLCVDIIKVQDELNVDAYISPALFFNSYSDVKVQRFVELSKTFLDCVNQNGRKIPSLISLPISNRIIADANLRKELLDHITSIDCDGFYISLNVDEGDGYVLSRPVDITSLINFVFILKKNKYYVLMGHSHHVSYLLLCAGIDAFSSGHYKNLRSFDVARWETEESFGRQPAINYFSIPLLNDLRVDSDLEILYQSNFDLDKIKSNSPFENQLFTQSPTYAGWGLRNSWDQYLWCCNNLLQKLKGLSLDKRIEIVEQHIEAANELYSEILKNIGILTQPDQRIYTSWKSSLQILRNLIQSE